MHRVRVQLNDIEKQVKEAIHSFNSNKEIRACKNCGHIMPEEVEEWKCE